MNKQELEEARQLAMSMTSHPVAFGTIEHTEQAGELLGMLCAALDQKHAEYEDLKACAANNARNLAREAHTWSKAAEHYAKLREPLTREQIDAVMTEHYPLSSLLREEVDAFERCVRDIERMHGIGG